MPARKRKASPARVAANEVRRAPAAMRARGGEDQEADGVDAATALPGPTDPTTTSPGPGLDTNENENDGASAAAAAASDPAPSETVTIDWQGFPHIVEKILVHIDWPTRLAFRATNRHFRALVDLTRVEIRFRPRRIYGGGGAGERDSSKDSWCMIEGRTPAGAFVFSCPCDANLRRDAHSLRTCVPWFDSERCNPKAKEVRGSFRNFVLDISVRGACPHRPRALTQLVEILCTQPNRWWNSTTVPLAPAPRPASAPAPVPLALPAPNPPLRRSARLQDRARARAQLALQHTAPPPPPATGPRRAQSPIPPQWRLAPRARTITVVPDARGAITAPPCVIAWAHVRRDDYRANTGAVQMEWPDDVVVFPLTGREPATRLFNTRVTRATVVYDFAEWDAGAAAAAVSAERAAAARDAEAGGAGGTGATGAAGAADGDGNGDGGGEGEGHADPRLRSLVAHATANLVSNGSIWFSASHKAWHTPAAGIQWLCPTYAAAHLAPVLEQESAPTVIAAFQAYVADTIAAALLAGGASRDEAALLRSRVRFLPEGREWDRQRLRADPAA